jgi:hypothetical protein
MESFISLGKEFGLEGKELMAFVKEQQEEERKRLDDERVERQREREAKKLEAEERERERQYRERELEAERNQIAMKQLELEQSSTTSSVSGQGGVNASSGAKLPKLPEFVDGKDDLDSYLQRFERFAKGNQWKENTWATSLSALLTGRALDVYSRLSESAAVDYPQLREALLKRYELTENGFRVRFSRRKTRGCRKSRAIHDTSAAISYQVGGTLQSR